MNKLPESLRAAWAERESIAVFATSDTAGLPNCVYVGSMNAYGDDKIIIADNYFSKTRANILAGSRGSLLFLTKTRKSYQLKGFIEYHETGPLFDEMKRWNPTRHPGVAAVALRVTEAYSGSERLL